MAMEANLGLGRNEAQTPAVDASWSRNSGDDMFFPAASWEPHDANEYCIGADVVHDKTNAPS